MTSDVAAVASAEVESEKRVADVGRGLLQQVTASGSLTLASALFDGAFGTLLDGVVLDGVSVIEDDPVLAKRLKVTGTLRDAWPIPSSAKVSLVGAKFELTADVETEKVSLTLSDAVIGLSNGRSVKATASLDQEGSFSLALDRIGLVELLHEIAGEPDFALPAGFPDILLAEPRLRFAVRGESDVALQVNTAVVVNGWTVDVAVLLPQSADAAGKVTRRGYAVALWSSHWSTGWVPSGRWAAVPAPKIDRAGLLVASAPSLAESTLARLAPPDAGPTHPAALLVDHAGGLQRGYTFLGAFTLEQAPSLRPVSDALALDTFELFLTESASGRTKIKATGFSTSGKPFDYASGVELCWTTEDDGSSVMDLSASGFVELEADKGLGVSITGSLSFDGYGAVSLKLQDWVAPFGVERITVRELKASLTIDPAGVLIGLAGSFEFTTASGKRVTFAVAGMLRDFAAPGALAFTLRSASSSVSLTLGEIIAAVTSIDVSDSTSSPAKAVQQIDRVLSISKLALWAVVGAEELTVAEEVYAPGFGFQGDATILGRKLRLFIEVEGADHKFSGYAELPETVSFGSVLTLARPAAPAVSPEGTLAARSLEPGRGPIVSVSSEIDDTYTDYLLVAASVAVFDLVRVDVFTRINPDGLAFSVGVDARVQDPSGDSAGWAKQSITVTVASNGGSGRAQFSCDFGLRDVSLGGFAVYGIPVPKVELPDFQIVASLDVSVDTVHKALDIKGGLRFSFAGLDLSAEIGAPGSKPIRLALADAPGAVADLGAPVFTWIRDHLAALVTEQFASAEEFARWARSFLGASAAQVAKALKSGYRAGSATVASLLHSIGYGPDDVISAMTSAYSWSTTIATAWGRSLGSHVLKFVESKNESMVLFNLTDRTVVSDGKYGNDIHLPHAAVTVHPGEAAVVATFSSSTGNWGYVYLKDATTGTRFQLYIQLSSIVGNPYSSLQYVNSPNRDNNKPRPLPAGAASSNWNGEGPAAYTLNSLPPDPAKH